jgi:hypothetical protein
LPSGANNASGCGGLTGVTSFGLYRDRIIRTQGAWCGDIKLVHFIDFAL